MLQKRGGRRENTPDWKGQKTPKNSSVRVPPVGARPRPFLVAPALRPPTSTGGHRVLLRLPVLGEVGLERVDVALEAQSGERPEQVVAVDRLALLALALVRRLVFFLFFGWVFFGFGFKGFWIVA